MSTTWTAGVVGHGVASPSRTRKLPDLCSKHGHPGVTYHPQMDRTWCSPGEGFCLEIKFFRNLFDYLWTLI